MPTTDEEARPFHNGHARSRLAALEVENVILRANYRALAARIAELELTTEDPKPTATKGPDQ